MKSPVNWLFLYTMLSLSTKDLPIPQLHQYLLGAVGPRPICFASTVDKDGKVNLAPFSFFNVFAANPPIAIFSPNLSGKTGKAKDTHMNVKEVPEVVINVVNYDMVYQMSLASSPYPKGTNEFVKAGFTEIPSLTVKPPRVKESPVQLECKVFEVKEIKSCNLVMCEVQMIHINEEVLDANKLIDQKKIDLVARMGGNWYCRAHGNALFEIEKPITTIGIGVDSLPASVKNSHILTGNNLGQLANVEVLPSNEEVSAFKTECKQKFGSTELLHQYVRSQLENGKVKDAWLALLSNN
jgi:flavin reductase (DIM6/NTAB) family NADH-FMN oxidoreductase RutF